MASPSTLHSTALAVSLSVGIPIAVYIILLSLMITFPSIQTHAIYLHKVTLTWFRNLNVPEQFGFAHRQVIPFHIPVADGSGVVLHAWHVLPLGAYVAHHDEIVAQPGLVDGKAVEDVTTTVNFRLLARDPDAKLVVYFHGTSGTIASGYRPASYRALYAADSSNIHVLTFDYRGYGMSTGKPSEEGLIADARAVVLWAVTVAEIPPHRIVIFGQSLGSAVAIALVQALVTRCDAVERGVAGDHADFAGLVVTASFSDVPALTKTYRIGGFLPILSPVAKVGPLFRFFTRRLSSRWDNTGRLAELVRSAGRYHITLIHAEDDGDIPIEHSKRLFRAAIEAAEQGKNGEEDGDKDGSGDGVEDEGGWEARIRERTVGYGEGGSTMLWTTEKGEVRFEVLKYGVHDKIMEYPVTSMAVRRAFLSMEEYKSMKPGIKLSG